MTTTTILSDNGASSGSAGLKTTGGNDGTLQLQTTTSGGTATTALTIDTSQNVGIGTSSPVSKLDALNATVGKSAFSARGISGNLYIDYNGAGNNYYEANYHLFTNNNGSTEWMRIDSSGNVGIGTSSPSNKLVVSGNTAGVVSAIFNSSTTSGSSSSTLQLATNNGGNYANWNVAYVSAGGSYIQLNQSGVGTAYYDIDTQIWRNGSGTEQSRIDSSGVFYFNSGYGSSAKAYGCRAWVNFNGTGTVAIRGSGNVSSITDNGTGDYTVNFTSAMPDTNYCMSSAGDNNNNGQGTIVIMNTAATAPATGSCRVMTRVPSASTAADGVYINCTFFR